MEGDTDPKKPCRICGGTDFFKDAGYYYCGTCQTQNEDVREEVLEMHVDPNTRLRKVTVKKQKVKRHGGDLNWTTWELYNFVLIGLIEELIELGVSPNVRLTVLQLWAAYLSKIEVAFTSMKKKCVPRLSRKYNKKDAEIIYGKVRMNRRSSRWSKSLNSTSNSVASGYQSDGSSTQTFHKSKKLMIKAEYDKYLQSQVSSDNDASSAISQSGYSTRSEGGRSSAGDNKVHFNKRAKQEKKKVKKLSKKVPLVERGKYKETHSTTQYRTGPQIITPMKLWAIIYLALRIHDEPIQLGDMLRYAREGHMSYYRLDHLFSSEIKLSQSDVNFLSQTIEITHKGMRRIAASLAKFIGVTEIKCPDFLPLITRYCQELALPRGVLLYATRLIALAPPAMTYDSKKSYIPNYEARAMAYIIVVLKVLFGLDGVTERAISKTAEHINIVASERGVLDRRLYSFCEWQRYIECRKNILSNVYFPIKLKYNPNVPSKNNIYLKFFKYIQSKRDDGAVEVTNYKHLIPRDLANAMKQCIENLNKDNNLPLEEEDVFAPSLTPFHSYLQQLLDDSTNTLPDVLRTDFYVTKVGYMTNIEAFRQLALQCNINLEITDSTLHFIDKFVPYFEPTKLPNLSEFQEDVLVCDHNELKDTNIKTIDNFATYIDKNISSYIKIDDTKLQYFKDSQNLLRMTTNSQLNNQNDFVFRDVLPNGKLLISEASDSEPEDEDILRVKDVSADKTNVTNTDILKKYGVALTDYERKSIFKQQDLETIESFVKRKMHRFRDSKGKFIKAGRTEELKNFYKSVKSKIGDELNITELHNFTGLNFDITTEMDLFSEICDNIFPLQDEQQLLNNGECNSDGSLPNLDDCFNLSNISILCEDSVDKKLDNNDKTSPTNNLEDSIEQKSNSTTRFYRPFKDYWMYHCIFSRVKGKNFELFEKVLPRSFRWLLNECANILEMTTEDLYEEVCMVESFHSQILKPNNSDMNTQKNSPEFISRFHRSLIISKW